MLGVKCMLQNFENVLLMLLTNREFHVKKPMNTAGFVSKQLTKNNLYIWVNPGKRFNISESHREIFRGVEYLWIKETDSQIYTMSQIVLMISPVQFDIKHCGIQFIQSLMVYTAVYQWQETRHVAHLAFCKKRIVSFSWDILVDECPWPFSTL